MGIGRREFLRLFGGGLAATIGSPASAIAFIDDYYVNRRLGIAFQKPAGWMFTDIREMGQIIEGQILNLDDPEYEQLVKQETDLPLLTISPNGISHDADRFEPGVTVYVQEGQTDDSDGVTASDQSPILQVHFDMEYCAEILKDFHVVSLARPRTISNCPAAEYESTFLFEHVQIEPTPVRMRTLFVDQGFAQYTLRMYDSPHLGGEFEFDYSGFLDSVKLV